MFTKNIKYNNFFLSGNKLYSTLVLHNTALFHVHDFIYIFTEHNNISNYFTGNNLILKYIFLHNTIIFYRTHFFVEFIEHILYYIIL